MDSILKDDDLDDCTNSPTILFLISRLHLEPIKNINIEILFIRNWTKKLKQTVRFIFYSSTSWPVLLNFRPHDAVSLIGLKGHSLFYVNTKCVLFDQSNLRFLYFSGFPYNPK